MISRRSGPKPHHKNEPIAALMMQRQPTGFIGLDAMGTPMASDVSKIKIEKLCHRDFTRQAGISDVLKNSKLVVDAARAAGTAFPLMEACVALYTEKPALETSAGF